MTYVDPDVSLELLNGGVAIIAATLLVMMGRYLRNEVRRRKLGWSAFLQGRYPPSMNFAVAVFVFDSGIGMRATVLWSWRFFGADNMSRVMWSFLIYSALVILVGGLCKIRALTKNDFGDGPWLVTLWLVLTLVGLTLAFR